MSGNSERLGGPVVIERGLSDWQILQQDADGTACVTIAGSWSTIMRRKKPEVRVRIVREGTFSAIGRRFDRICARTTIDRSITGDAAGKSGRWRITITGIPAGGPYRFETTIGSVEDAIEWRRSGDVVHFFGVGDIWLITGQSNAEGYGQSPVDDPSEIGVHEFCVGRGWMIAAHGSHHSPWLAFAKTLKKDLGYPIGLIPVAVGGSSMSQWDPGQKGVLFGAMKRALADSGKRARGVIWYQGESDTTAEDLPLYKVRFGRFVTGLRSYLKEPELPVITYQLNRLLGRENDFYWEGMREVQRQLSHEIENTFVVSIFESVLCDGIHNGSLGCMLAAQRAVETALGGIYGRDIHFRQPECIGAELITEKAIELLFANVVTRLDYGCRITDDFPFAVRDEEGDVPVTGYTIPGKNRFVLELERALCGRATVTGVPGSHASHILPKDINGYRSMLAFTMDVDR